MGPGWMVLLLVGCAKKGAGPESAPVPAVLNPAAVPGQVAAVIEGPARWSDPVGLCLEIPAGWQGQGADATGGLVTLSLVDSEVRVGVYLASAPLERDGLVRVFVDKGSYRSLPALGLGGVETWVSEAPGGPTLQVWQGVSGERPVRVEARYPDGEVIRGMAEVEALLGGLCVQSD